jgi:uncharacterized protein YjbI with pentapeptide repeats
MRSWQSASPLAKKNLWHRLFGTRFKAGRYSEKMRSVSRSLPGGAAKVSWRHRFSSLNSKGEFFFYPGANLESVYIDMRCDLRGVNLQETNFKNGRLQQANLDGANLTGADLSKSSISGSMRDTILCNTNLEEANLDDVDLSGADLTGANLRHATLSRDLTNVNITGEQFEQLNEIEKYDYPAKNFHEVAQELGVSEKQFEFLVLSGAVEVRDKHSNERVLSDFDTEKHNIPVWGVEELKNALSQKPVTEAK